MFRPIHEAFLNDDHTYVDKQHEKNFINYWQFKIPLYLYVITSFLIWIWMIILWSTEYKPDHWIFNLDTGTFAQSLFFHQVLAHHGNIAMAAGHELFHSRDTVHKIFGMIPFVTCFWSQLYDQHIAVHHKLAGTPEDYFCAPVG